MKKLALVTTIGLLVVVLGQVPMCLLQLGIKIERDKDRHSTKLERLFSAEDRIHPVQPKM